MNKIRNKIFLIIFPVLVILGAFILPAEQKTFAQSPLGNCNYKSISFEPLTTTGNLSTAPSQVVVVVSFEGSDCFQDDLSLFVRNSENSTINVMSDTYKVKANEIEARFIYTPAPTCTPLAGTNPAYCAFFAILSVNGNAAVLNTGGGAIGTAERLIYKSTTPPGGPNFTWRLVKAEGVTAPNPPAGGGGSGSGTGGGGSTNPASTLPKLDNPLCAPGSTECIDSVPAFIQKIVEVIVLVAIPLVALAIMYSGFLLVMGAATGNTSKIEQGKKALLYSIIGGAILLGAWVIAEVIGNTVNDIAGYN